ncbi:uncharacterized protein METZ01_LOCUS148353, partial [marine metagenome]
VFGKKLVFANIRSSFIFLINFLSVLARINSSVVIESLADATFCPLKSIW